MATPCLSRRFSEFGPSSHLHTLPSPLHTQGNLIPITHLFTFPRPYLPALLRLSLPSPQTNIVPIFLQHHHRIFPPSSRPALPELARPFVSSGLPFTF